MSPVPGEAPSLVLAAQPTLDAVEEQLAILEPGARTDRFVLTRMGVSAHTGQVSAPQANRGVN